MDSKMKPLICATVRPNIDLHYLHVTGKACGMKDWIGLFIQDQKQRSFYITVTKLRVVKLLDQNNGFTVKKKKKKRISYYIKKITNVR